MNGWAGHLIVVPILLPLIASAIMLLLDERQRRAKNAISLVTHVALLGVAVTLMVQTVQLGFSGNSATRVYLIGDWAAPYGIVLVADWLSSLMLLLASILGLASFIYAVARWDRAGPRFQVLHLLQMMGLNGAFLTGDLFNLFVFFEILLAASYGLMLHGSGTKRVTIGMHYVAINVATSLLFLIGVGLIYGIAGTLNMADLATIILGTRGTELTLLQSGFAVLGLAFLIKAGMWPVGFWLPKTYAAAVPPAAALFSILSKVGIYALLRVYLLLFTSEVGWPANFGGEWLLYGGIATLIYGTLGVLAARTLSRVAGYCVIISSGTLLGTIGASDGAVLGGALFYLVSSTLGIGAFYLLLELVERRETESSVRTIVEPVFEDEYTGARPEENADEVRIVIPATIAILGGGFMFCALLLSGLPPLSGFIAKFAIIHGLLNLEPTIAPAIGLLVALMIISGMATLVATTRAGIDLLWTPSDRPPPPLRLAEAVPVGLLLLVCLGLMVFAGPTMRYMERTGVSLQDRQGYINAVLGADRRTTEPRTALP
ncbi:monovalent cation/H+ antiporter subunit D [Sphingobium sp. D43FB]|uniref:monovalent cation/H+ antiporter subunit D n=1 Tax=Sphingobium sp. D43FB TaxID=2017595 RepID=UPI000BB54003|nr:monovalent cation/H+ antiporter subunit D [Sphingobium sp. D43FB]PBN41401.1 monovalent cation/H+ antiporter subunit D [Sphingobium sp. D43FB]